MDWKALLLLVGPDGPKYAEEDLDKETSEIQGEAAAVVGEGEARTVAQGGAALVEERLSSSSSAAAAAAAAATVSSGSMRGAKGGKEAKQRLRALLLGPMVDLLNGSGACLPLFLLVRKVLMMLIPMVSLLNRPSAVHLLGFF